MDRLCDDRDDRTHQSRGGAACGFRNPYCWSWSAPRWPSRRDFRPSAKRNEVTARVAGIGAALDRLKQFTDGGAVARSVANLRRLHEGRLTDFVHTSEGIDAAPVAEAAGIQLQLVAAERASIASQYAAEKLTDEARRRIERELDLEDARIRHAADSAAGNGFREI